MTLRLLTLVGVLVVVLTLPGRVSAQESTFSGTVTDSTGGVLPGVAVTAWHEASGNSFLGVTDERGVFRIPVRAGVYRITAELPGFASITRTGLELLVGQAVTANLQMSPSSIEESVTVTGEAPLINISSSSIGGNIDPRQMSELPVNGRNWQDLVSLAPGARANAVGTGSASSEQPTPGTRRGASDFQLTMDGQEVTNNQCCRGQPSFSKDAIAEFQFLASRFDATQGRSAGVQVNVITKSGTNRYAGSFAGYFRDDRFKAADFFTGTVLPYSDQQISTTYGGPVLRDRLHFFANYEYEREPMSFNFNSPYPTVNAVVLTGVRNQKMGGVRLDYQVSSQIRLMVRSNLSSEARPYEGAAGHPAASEEFERDNQDAFATLTHVLSNRALNEIKVGFAGFNYSNQNHAVNPNHPQAFNGITRGGPRITFTNYAIGGNAQAPQGSSENKYSIRDDFSFSFSARGRHDLKMGGEYFYMIQGSRNCRNCMGIVDAQNGPGPTPEQFARWFPVWDDVSTWDMTAISPLVRRYTLGVGNFKYAFDRRMPNAWFQDDWAITSRLTLNLGIRYELIKNAWMNSVELLPFLTADRPDDQNNVAPRLGFAYSLDDRTVVRGGVGQYFGYPVHNVMSFTISHANIANVEITNDGRPDFAAHPFNGPIPTFDQLQANFCSTRNVPGCVRRGGLTQLAPPADLGQIPHSWQSSIGFQRQIRDTMAFEADYAFNGSRRERDDTPNVNVAYDPATGLNYPFSDISRRPFPEWGVIAMVNMAGESNYHGLQTAFTKRMSDRWQAAATYTLSWLYSRDPQPLTGIGGQVVRAPFALADDLGGAYGLSENDQRHRAVLNGIWQMPLNLQLSGLYFFGSGERVVTTYGGDRRNLGVAGRSRLRPDGSLVTRNDFVGHPLHRIDVRLQRRFAVGGRAAIDGIVEVFNLFNHENYGSYTTAESNTNYGEPTPNPLVAYQPRMLQFGFRATF
jgi:hypothetical protein